MSSRLDEIVAHTRERVRLAFTPEYRAGLETAARGHRPREFVQALRARAGGAVIGELKRASPSRGIIRGDLNVAETARELELAGAAALSVLTEERWFLGSLESLRVASQATALPCLRKDFMVVPEQMLEARAFRADAVLLIVAALEDSVLLELAAAAREQELDILVEVHAPAELERALRLGGDAIGVNSRNLHTFSTSLEDTVELGHALRAEAPDVLRVAESAIRTAEDIRGLRDAGFAAFLIGETLMRADCPGDKLRELLQPCG